MTIIDADHGAAVHPRIVADTDLMEPRDLRTSRLDIVGDRRTSAPAGHDDHWDGVLARRRKDSNRPGRCRLVRNGAALGPVMRKVHPEPAKEPLVVSEKNKKVAVTYLKALVEGDAMLMDSILTDDFNAVDRGTAKISGRRSREEVVAFTAAVPSLFKERLRFEYESVTAEADRVVCQLKGYSKLPDGREYNNEYIYLFHIRDDGKIYHMDGYYDTKLADERVFETMEQQDIK